MRKKETRARLEGLLVLLIFALFAASLLLVLLTGAGTYQRLSARDEKSYARATSLQYIAAKIHRFDQAGAVTIAPFFGKSSSEGEGIPTLTLREKVDGAWYQTRIYYYEGYVRELFAEENTALAPQDGTPVLESGGLSFAEQAGVILVTVKAQDGTLASLSIGLRSEGGMAHESE